MHHDTKWSHGTIISRAKKLGSNRSRKYRHCWNIEDPNGIITPVDSEREIPNWGEIDSDLNQPDTSPAEFNIDTL